MKKICINCQHYEWETGSDVCKLLKKIVPDNGVCKNFKEYLTCKKCKHGEFYTDGEYFCKLHNLIMLDDDFCEEGEKK
jgi:hypothetical protein